MKRLATRIALLAALTLCCFTAASAQGRKSLRINEVMVVNDSSIVDDYGDRSAWIELLNPTHAAVEISSIYLTDDLAEPTKYYVPRGDKATKVGKGQAVLFHADGKPHRGTFHLNFSLTPGRPTTLYVFDADGKSIIDSVAVPANLPANCSYARTPDGSGQWSVRDDSTDALAITPGGHNVIKGPNNKIAQFEKMDSNGTAMAMMAMSIVFGALLVLCICFVMIRLLSRRPAAKAPEATLTPAPQPAATADAEVAAAIAMALHQHLNAGIGSDRITIVHNPASAWTSKLHGMRQMPQRK